MKKNTIYKCHLYQIPSSVGYLECDNADVSKLSDDMQRTLFVGIGSNSLPLNIFVTRTDNPFVVKDVLTGIELPLVKATRTESEDKDANTNYGKCAFRSGEKRLHTFVKELIYESKEFGDTPLEFIDINRNDALKRSFVEYLKIDRDVQEKKIREFLSIGASNMNRALNEEVPDDKKKEVHRIIDVISSKTDEKIINRKIN